jgi:hypothetical protein
MGNNVETNRVMTRTNQANFQQQTNNFTAVQVVFCLLLVIFLFLIKKTHKIELKDTPLYTNNHMFLAPPIQTDVFRRYFQSPIHFIFYAQNVEYMARNKNA